MRRLILTILGVMAIAGFAPGCGGGDDETKAEKATSPPLTKAEFIKEAEAICIKSTKQRRAEITAWQKEFPGDEFEQVTALEKNMDEGVKEILAPSVQQQARELESLAPPAADEAKVSRMVGSLAKAGRRFEEEGAEALGGGGASEFEREATAYGLKACATV